MTEIRRPNDGWSFLSEKKDWIFRCWFSHLKTHHRGPEHLIRNMDAEENWTRVLRFLNRYSTWNRHSEKERKRCLLVHIYSSFKKNWKKTICSYLYLLHMYNKAENLWNAQKKWSCSRKNFKNRSHVVINSHKFVQLFDPHTFIRSIYWYININFHFSVWLA